MPNERIIKEVILAKRADGYHKEQYISAFTLTYTTRDGQTHDYREDSGRIITMETGLKYQDDTSVRRTITLPKPFIANKVTIHMKPSPYSERPSGRCDLVV